MTFQTCLQTKLQLYRKLNIQYSNIRDIIDDVLMNPSENEHIQSDNEIISDMRVVESNLVILNMTQSKYTICKNILNSIEKGLPMYVSKNGCSLELFWTLMKLPKQRWLEGSFHMLKAESASSDNEPELDITYNKKAESREVFITKLYPPLTNSLHEQLHGAKVYIPCNKTSEYIVLYGNFVFDPYQLKSSQLSIYKDLVKYLDNQPSYMLSFMKQLQLREFHTNTLQELKTMLKNSYTDMKKMICKSFNDIQLSFAASSMIKQRKIIIMLLLSDSEATSYVQPLFE